MGHAYNPRMAALAYGPWDGPCVACTLLIMRMTHQISIGKYRPLKGLREVGGGLGNRSGAAGPFFFARAAGPDL